MENLRAETSAPQEHTASPGRRLFLHAAVTTALSAIVSGGLRDVVCAEENEHKNEAGRRVAQLKYVLRPPEKESYQFADKQLEFELNAKQLSFSIPKDTKPRESLLFEVLTYSPHDPPVEIVTDERGRTYYLLSRSHLEGEGIKEMLKRAAEAGRLPRISPVWFSSDGSHAIPLGTISLEPKSRKHVAAILAFAKKNGLRRIRDDIGTTMRFDLPTESSAFVSPFRAVQAFTKQGTVSWCEPDFAVKLRGGKATP